MFYLVFNYTFKYKFISSTIYSGTYYVAHLLVRLLKACKKTLGEGFIYLRGLVILLAIDASLTDDEPL